MSSASRRSSEVKRLSMAAFAMTAGLACAPPVSAQAPGPFVGMEGSWRGIGRVTLADGRTERIACRASYVVSDDGINMSQSLVCASDSYRFDIRTNVFTDGQNLRGTWQETTRDASGNLTGDIHDGAIRSVVTAPGFSAALSVKTTGRKQVVSIDPQGTSVAKVDVTLSH